MTEHLTQNQIGEYVGQKLATAELLSLSDHLVECATCREQVEKALRADQTFFALRSEVFGADAEVVSTTGRMHASSEQVTEYVDGILAAEQMQLLEDHLASCEQCFLLVSDLRAFRDEVAPQLNREYRPARGHTNPEGRWRHLVGLLPSPFSKSPVLAFSSAFVLLMLIGAGWLVWQTLERRETKPELAAASPSPNLTPPLATNVIPTASPTVTPEERTAPVIAQLNDGGAQVILDQAGNLSGVDYLPPNYQQLLKEWLKNQRVEKSALLAGLGRPGSPLMSGSGEGNKFSVIEPVGRVLQLNRPTFRWSRLEGATGYFIEIYDEKFNPVATSPQVTDNSWTSEQSLPPGIYSWQVKAIKAGQELKTPQPPARQAKFRILDSARLNELQQARRAYPSSHLLLGQLYLRAGLLAEAEKEFLALQKANPDSPLVRRLVSQVRNLQR